MGLQWADVDGAPFCALPLTAVTHRPLLVSDGHPLSGRVIQFTRSIYFDPSDECFLWKFMWIMSRSLFTSVSR